MFESVPPGKYGGTERVVHYLTEELVRMGCDVTLFASGDSRTSAELVPMCVKALRHERKTIDYVSYHLLMVEKALKSKERFDIIHSHIDCMGFMLGRRAGVPVVNTMHGRLDMPESARVLSEYMEAPLISISDAQRIYTPQANWIATVYHGIPSDLYCGNYEKSGGYLAFVGRMSPEKRVDTAIQIATKAGIPLKIAAKVDRTEAYYFEQELKPLLDNPLVEFLGEVDDREKNELIGSALAFLYPIDWPEPFGLAMIEAMACGTPVVARRRGSVPEVVDHGVTGFIFDEVDEAVRYIHEDVPGLSRKLCREHFEKRFVAHRMAADYMKLYQQICGKGEAEIA